MLDQCLLSHSSSSGSAPSRATCGGGSENAVSSIGPGAGRAAPPDARSATFRPAGGAAGASPDAELLAQHPELSDGEFVILLLHTAAGIEHSLLVQYLYAAYSLNMNPALPAAGGPPADTVGWRASIARLAKERMGHLLCIQNVLRAMGGPLQFTRPRFPYRSRFYPFAFQLEPLTKNVLAKYVAAEMPDTARTRPFCRWSNEKKFCGTGHGRRQRRAGHSRGAAL